MLTIEVDDSNAYVLTDNELRRHFFIVVTEGSPAPTATIAVQVPAIRRGLFKLLNLTQQTVAIEVPGQSEPAPQIAPLENRMLSCDGSDVRASGIGAERVWAAVVHGLRTNTTVVTATAGWTICRWGWQFAGSEGLDEAYVPFFGAYGAPRDDAMVARWSANPLGMLWPEMDVELVTSGGVDGPAVLRRRVIVIAAD